MPRTLHVRTLAVFPLIALLVGTSPRFLCAASAGPETSPPASRARFARPAQVSVAGQELMRAVWEAGGLRNNPWAESVVRGLREEETEGFPGDALLEAAPELPSVIQALGNDAIVNNRALSTCTCSGRPINQMEPSIAAWGPYVLASWNDRRTACAGSGSPSQSHAWSMDYGATFREGQLLRGPGATDVFSGLPTVAANKKTGDFYISGLLRRGTSNTLGIVAVRGQFGPDSFTIDLRKVITLQATDDFVDRPAMAVDSSSGNVYVTWSHFRASDLTINIRLQRLDRNLDPLGPDQQITNYPAGFDYPNSTYPTVGADGEFYVPYLYVHADTTELWNHPSPLAVLRSDDGGLTFGPPHTIASIDYHPLATPPGFQRGFYTQLFAADIDRSNGPHRGRLYATWAENRPIVDPVLGDTTVDEVETNDFFVRANPFIPGMKLHGENTGVETDVFKFTGQRGQVFYCRPDSGGDGMRLRLLCDEDTTSVARYHLLFARSPSSVGASTIVSGLPYDGTYYLQMDSPFNNFGVYLLSTGLIPLPAGAHARDIRDVFLSYSDDGTTWSTPVRLNDDDPGFDNDQPQVAVDGRGRVHAFWADRRGEPECGTSSSQYGASSGDGGATWGPNRQLSDASSFWGQLASCTTDNQGEFMQMTADGDHVYAAFPDTRLGDPDVFVDASVYRFEGLCPRDSLVAPNHEAGLVFTLANGGNFETALAWQVSNDASWTMSVSPAASGQTSVTAGGSTSVLVTVQAPPGCTRDSTIVRFVTSDPAIPGDADTCIAVVRCDDSVPVLVSLAEQRVGIGRVNLRWQVQDAAGATATVLRRDAGLDWRTRATPPIGRSGVVDFEDRDVPPGRHGYRLVIEHDAQGRFESETWVDVPGAVLTLEPVHPNPASRGALTLDFSVPSTTDAAIDVFDMAGRRVVTRTLGALTAGRHLMTLSEASALRDGIYLVVLRQGGRSVSRKAVFAR